MKHYILAGLIAVFAMPISAKAQETKPAPAQANCPAANMADMRKQMDGMLGDVGTMMRNTKDPATKEQLVKMRDRMALMMTSMQQMRGMNGAVGGGRMMGNGMMGGGMMGGGMMGGGMMGGGPSPKPPQTSPDDPHHPNP